jgi:Ca-activated chloride channel family protein
LLLLLPLTVLLIWSWRVRQKLLTQFISSRLLGSLTSGVSRERQKIRLILFVVSVALLLVALARPRWGFSLEDARQRGLDIVIAIDTSKSMLADDVQPNRLQRAKLAALDLMRLAESDRLGLVAFAGSAFLQCPLSLDEEAFRQSVDFLDVSVIPQGGTALAEAIVAARSAFKEEAAENHKILVLFTDGEENDDRETALEATREAAKAGLRIFTVGVGTPAGEVLSTTDPYGNRVFIKDSQGNVVKSRLNEPLLQQIAKETDGFYLPLTGARAMDVLYERGLAPLPKSEFSTRTIRQYHERFPWFIGAAIVLLLAEMLFPERRKDSRSKVSNPKFVTLAGLLLCFSALNTVGSVNGALKNYERGQFSKARSEFERLAKKSPEDARLRFNAGAAAYQEQDYESALKHFSATLNSPDLKLIGKGLYNLGNTYFRLGENEKEPQKILEQWQQASNQYNLALKVDEKDTDAKSNLEVVAKKIEELKKQQEQQKQQQQDQQDQKKEDGQKRDQNKQEEQKQDKGSESQKQDQEKQQEEKEKQEQEKKNQESQQQKEQEQKKQDEQQSSSQDQRGKEPDQSPEAANYGRVMQMTPQQAQQLLDAQRSEERAMIFQPQNLRTNRPPRDRVFKDW